MEEKKEKTYEFYGVDNKTAWRMALLAVVILIVSLVISDFILLWLWRKYIIGDKFITGEYETKMETRIFYASVGIAFCSFVAFFKFLGKKNRRLWSLTKIDDKIIIKYKGETHEIFLKDIVQINNLGKAKTRAKKLTIKYNNQSVKIWAGTSWQAPFSREGDLQILDSFIKRLTNFLSKNFTRDEPNSFFYRKIRSLYKKQVEEAKRSFIGVYKRKTS